jgi:methyl coenzyme M reductase subunit C-like uncharacterized protein (methanogenesis marker protein 7)
MSFTALLNHRPKDDVIVGWNQPHHPTNGALDKSVLGGSWIAVVAQTLADMHATHGASFIDPSSQVFKDLDASHPSERAILCDG